MGKRDINSSANIPNQRQGIPKHGVTGEKWSTSSKDRKLAKRRINIPEQTKTINRQNITETESQGYANA